MGIQDVLKTLAEFLRDRFNLGEDRLGQAEVAAIVAKGTEIRGLNVWVLVFAILTAAIGLNVNSTAVIIGAMLISPLMGPIMGIGLAVAILDWPLYKKALKNFLLMVAISLSASTLYFLLTPLSMARSELLARTTPAIWDVGIALFGGMAGMVALNSRERGNVLPGVAIATALMPPLCTAGYGLATGRWTFLAGALYLFLINTVFISLGTLAVARLLRFTHVAMPDARTLARVRRGILALVLVTVLPSLYLAWGLVKEGFREQRATEFLASQFPLGETRVLTWELDTKARPARLDVMLVGRPLAADTLALLHARWNDSMHGEVELVLHQEGAQALAHARQVPSGESLDAMLLHQAREELGYWRGDPSLARRLLEETRALEPTVRSLAFSPALRATADGVDTVLLVEVSGWTGGDDEGRRRLEDWLSRRLGQREVLLRARP